MSFAETLLADYRVVLTIPVQWGDQDAMGHVNNVMYFRWFESARIRYLERIGLAGQRESQQVDVILAQTRCNFRRQLSYPDTIAAAARITRIGRSSMTMEYAVASQSQQAIVADGDSTIVAFDYQAGATQPVPDELREAIAALEGREL